MKTKFHHSVICKSHVQPSERHAFGILTVVFDDVTEIPEYFEASPDEVLQVSDFVFQIPESSDIESDDDLDIHITAESSFIKIMKTKIMTVMI